MLISCYVSSFHDTSTHLGLGKGWMNFILDRLDHHLKNTSPFKISETSSVCWGCVFGLARLHWIHSPQKNVFFFKEVFKTLRKFLIENFMLTIGLKGEVVSKREMDLWYIVWILPLDGCSWKEAGCLSACPVGSWTNCQGWESILVWAISPLKGIFWTL